MVRVSPPGMTCAARCPFKNSPGGLVSIMREVAIKHEMQSAKDVLRPFGRVMLKLITTGNQLSPDMIKPDHFAATRRIPDETHLCDGTGDAHSHESP